MLIYLCYLYRKLGGVYLCEYTPAIVVCGRKPELEGRGPFLYLPGNPPSQIACFELLPRPNARGLLLAVVWGVISARTEWATS